MEIEGDEFYKQASELSNDKSLVLFNKAVIKYLASRSYLKAADTFCKIAELHVENGNINSAAFCLKKAGEYYTDVDNIAFEICFKESIKLFVHDYKYINAARTSEILAHTFAMQSVNSYEQAYNYYHMNGLITEGINCLSKAIDILVGQEQYEPANKCLLIIFSHLDMNSPDKASKIIFQIGIIKLYLKNVGECRLWLNMCKIYNKYKDYILLNDLIDAYEKFNKKLFVEIMDQCGLERWEKKLLLKIKALM